MSEINNNGTEQPGGTSGMETTRTLKHFPPYGTMNENLTRDCPTCRGIGRIPRGQEDQLVAVIPCNDVRLKPRRTKQYVFTSMILCLLLCSLILYFLFPRSVSVTPVSVLSVMVYFSPHAVLLKVTNLISITNDNFVTVQILDFNVQGVVSQAIVTKNQIYNISTLQPRSQKSYTIEIDLPIKDEGLVTYCESDKIKIRTLFLEMQMTLNISYISHSELVTAEAYEYIDCGTNRTTPHPVRDT
ncbi:transmembrane protein 106A [Nelusetta ayraudi]|uniref:transmembrane protein 106A n=1 Tax=Nelusetta ayraudi TaxID=303726 RepID=UPI003F72EBF4